MFSKRFHAHGTTHCSERDFSTTERGQINVDTFFFQWRNSIELSEPKYIPGHYEATDFTTNLVGLKRSLDRIPNNIRIVYYLYIILLLYYIILLSYSLRSADEYFRTKVNPHYEYVDGIGVGNLLQIPIHEIDHNIFAYCRIKNETLIFSVKTHFLNLLRAGRRVFSGRNRLHQFTITRANERDHEKRYIAIVSNRDDRFELIWKPVNT